MAGTPKKRERRRKQAEAATGETLSAIEQAVEESQGSFSLPQTLLIAQLALQGGENLKAAAATLGIGYERAKTWHAKDEHFRTAVKLASESVKQVALSTQVQEWATFHGKAQAKMAALMDSRDDRVAFNATQEVLNRIEGKPVQRTRDETPEQEPSVETPLMALAVALVFGKKAPNLAAALDIAQRNPALVQAYASRNTLPAAPEGAPPKEQETSDATA